jgi:hypothetical protein
LAQNELVPTVLIELPGGEGVVHREDGEIVVTHDVSDDRGQALRRGDSYRPVKTWLDGECSLVGGVLPPGAVSAEVVDGRGVRVAATVGGGAYAAIIEQLVDGDDPVVCCRDAAGDPVRRPPPDIYPSAPVTDAHELCPACGALDWEECVPSESWRGGRPGPGGTTIPSPIVVCRRCGHEEQEGALMRLSSPEDEDEDARAARIARARADQRVQQWYRNKITLLGPTFPIYAAEGWPAQINGSGWSGADLTQLTIAHTDTEDANLADERPRIEITTSTEEPFEGELALARATLEQCIHEEIMIEHPHAPDLSDAAITLWFREIDRRRRAAALAAARSETKITIDGAPASFLMLSKPSGRWVAVRRHQDLTVTIAARHLDPTRLTIEPIPDPAARLLGPEPKELGDA